MNKIHSLNSKNKNNNNSNLGYQKKYLLIRLPNKRKIDKQNSKKIKMKKHLHN